MFSTAENLHILGATGSLSSFVDIIKRATEMSIQEVGTKLVLSPIDIVVADRPYGVIPLMSTGAWADKNSVTVAIDPDFPGLADSLEEELRRTYAHELAHCVRICAVGFPKTLLEVMVSEGLADRVEAEITNLEPQPWSIALTDAEIEVLQMRAMKEYDNDNWPHRDWLYGSETRGIPQWTAYTIGFILVGAYMEKTGLPASKLITTPTIEFVS